MNSEQPVHFTIRRQIIEFGALPASKWLPTEDGSAAVQTLLQQLLDAAVPDGLHRRAPPESPPPAPRLGRHAFRAHAYDRHCAEMYSAGLAYNQSCLNASTPLQIWSTLPP